MSVVSTRTVQLVYTGDVVGTETIAAANNVASPGMVEIKTLASGANTITVPGGGTTPVAVTILPPAGNVNLLTLKGITGDTGVALHLTDPTSVALSSTVSTFVINAAAQVIGVRFYWT